MPVDLKPCVGVWRPEEYERYSRRALAELPPLSPRAERARAVLLRQLPGCRARRRGAGDGPRLSRGARCAGARGRGRRRRATAWSCGTGAAGMTIDRRCSAASRRSPRVSTTLLEMRRSSAAFRARGRRSGVPARRRSGGRPRGAGARRPRACAGARRRAARGARAAAGPDGDRLHVRRRRPRALVAERLGPTGTLVAIDRDPLAEERFRGARTRGRVLAALHPRGLRRGARDARRRGVCARTSSYFDLGMSSMQVDARERGLLLLLRGAAGHAHGPGAASSARARSSPSGTSAASPARCATSARSVTRRDRARDRAQARARADRDDAAARRHDQLRDPGARALRRRPSRQALLPGAANRGQRRARTARSGAAARLGACCATAARSRPSHFTRSRTVGSSAFSSIARAAASARPTCPCACAGASPKAALVARRAIGPSAEEIARNPRATSARLRGARKLTEGPEP